MWGSKFWIIQWQHMWSTPLTSHVTKFLYLQNVKLHLISSKALNFQLTKISRSFKTPAWFSWCALFMAVFFPDSPPLSFLIFIIISEFLFLCSKSEWFFSLFHIKKAILQFRFNVIIGEIWNREAEKEPQGFNYPAKRRSWESKKSETKCEMTIYTFFSAAMMMILWEFLHIVIAFRGTEIFFQTNATRDTKNMIDYDVEWHRLFPYYFNPLFLKFSPREQSHDRKIIVILLIQAVIKYHCTSHRWDL